LCHASVSARDEAVVRAVTSVLKPMFTPIRCRDKPMWRVVMMRHEDEWEIFVHDTLIRYITEKNLPDEVRMKLSMILAHDDKGYIKRGIPASVMSVYTNTFPSEFSDIGWRFNKQTYVVVISLECLRSLQGAEIHGNT